ncbi:MAG: hypothetical protein L6R37_004198 [Teloschistes peruensis]|nr:MAG: hypothetical protein L6R37_004198 [Teloschistes peruensis]
MRVIEDEDALLPPSHKGPYKFDYNQLSDEERKHYNLLSPEEKTQYQDAEKTIFDHMNSPAVESKLQGEIGQAVHEANLETPRDPAIPEKIKEGLFAMGETDPQDTGEDGDFEGNDITSTAHGELEQHREMREYARIAAWEMPMLSKLAKPFVLPGADKPLRFRYTTYMGETHPAENKVVLEFCTRDLPDLTEAQRNKLIKIVGVRYNPETDLVKMSCEMFETQAQNKRYLGDLVDTLMAEAKDPTDMFEDVPFDFRHHRYKPKMEFPEQWKVTEGRKAQLQATWRRRALADKEREQQGTLVDGVEVIEKMLENVIAQEAAPRVAVKGPAAKARPKRLPR